MLKTRIISGIVLAVTMITLITLGGGVFFVMIVFLSLIGLFELYQAMNIEKKALGFWGYIAAILYLVINRFSGAEYECIIFILVLIGMMMLFVMNFEKYKLEEVTLAFLGFCYVAGMFFYLYKIRMLESGAYFIWMLFIGAWGCDTCAYFTGRALGKHKLVPVLSPKKSVEGAIGGAIGAALIGILFGFVCGERIALPGNAMIYCGVICFVIALISQFGDLAASGIKRTYGIKDYGKLIPGHGGVLDRFDSVLFAAPVMYLLLLFAK